MKYEKLIYGIGSLALIGAAIMKIMHLPNANGILIFVFVVMSVFQGWHVFILKKKIIELESKKIEV